MHNRPRHLTLELSNLDSQAGGVNHNSAFLFESGVGLGFAFCSLRSDADGHSVLICVLLGRTALQIAVLKIAGRKTALWIAARQRAVMTAPGRNAKLHRALQFRCLVAPQRVVLHISWYGQWLVYNRRCS